MIQIDTNELSNQWQSCSLASINNLLYFASPGVRHGIILIKMMERAIWNWNLKLKLKLKMKLKLPIYSMLPFPQMKFNNRIFSPYLIISVTTSVWSSSGWLTFAREDIIQRIYICSHSRVDMSSFNSFWTTLPRYDYSKRHEVLSTLPISIISKHLIIMEYVMKKCFSIFRNFLTFQKIFSQKNSTIAGEAIFLL